MGATTEVDQAISLGARVAAPLSVEGTVMGRHWKNGVLAYYIVKWDGAAPTDSAAREHVKPHEIREIQEEPNV